MNDYDDDVHISVINVIALDVVAALSDFVSISMLISDNILFYKSNNQMSSGWMCEHC